MRFPGIAYSFMRPTDTAGPTALILSRHQSISGGGLSLIEFFFRDLSKDRILVLTNVALKAAPGLAQFVLDLKIEGVSQGELNFEIMQRTPLRTIDQDEDLNWQGEVYIQGGGPGTDTLRIFASFNSAVAANTAVVGFHGIIIPRGNMGGF
jgi:hypothetical protein